MRTAKMTGAGLVTLALTLTPGVTMAQSEADEMLPTPTYLTGTEQDAGLFSVDSNTEVFPWGTRETVGFSRVVESTDPRIMGDLDVVYTYDQAGALARGTGLARLVNDGGEWQGPVTILYYPDGDEFRIAVMEGSGGYEGLTYVMTNSVDVYGVGQPEGLIWEGGLPPVPNAEQLPD
jgi:hypothetical protein